MLQFRRVMVLTIIFSFVVSCVAGRKMIDDGDIYTKYKGLPKNIGIYGEGISDKKNNKNTFHDPKSDAMTEATKRARKALAKSLFLNVSGNLTEYVDQNFKGNISEDEEKTTTKTIDEISNSFYNESFKGMLMGTSIKRTIYEYDDGSISCEAIAYLDNPQNSYLMLNNANITLNITNVNNKISIKQETKTINFIEKNNYYTWITNNIENRITIQNTLIKYLNNDQKVLKELNFLKDDIAKLRKENKLLLKGKNIYFDSKDDETMQFLRKIAVFDGVLPLVAVIGSNSSFDNVLIKVGNKEIGMFDRIERYHSKEQAYFVSGKLYENVLKIDEKHNNWLIPAIRNLKKQKSYIFYK